MTDKDDTKYPLGHLPEAEQKEVIRQSVSTSVSTKDFQATLDKVKLLNDFQNKSQPE